MPSSASLLPLRRLLSTTMITKQQLPFMEPIHVLGSGSIGLLMASSVRIAFPNYPITMLLRPHHLPRLQQEEKRPSRTYIQVSLIQPQGRPRMVKIPARIIDDNDDMPHIRNILLTTKAPDARTALKSVTLQPHTRIFLFCNGSLAVREDISDLLTKEQEQAMTFVSTTHGAYRENFVNDDDDLYAVTHAGKDGHVMVQADEAFAQLLDQASLNASSCNDMEQQMWLKLAANCVINPLTSLLQCKNGELLEKGLYRGMAEPIMEEVAAVSSTSVDILRDFVKQVIEDSFENKSSMLQDVIHKRTTEIDYLNGHIVKKGKELGIPTPANEDMCQRINALP